MRRLRPAEWVWPAGGVALLASAFLPWVRRGPGNRLRGHDLVDTLVAFGNDIPGLSAARLTILWYLIPALGAVSWVVFGVAGVPSRAARIVAVAAAIVTAVTVVVFARLSGVTDLGIGAAVALAGAAALVGSVFLRPRPRTQ
ncbi:MAG: hypothetical protein SGJ13_04845 [Actinomycetota bacterium]|nr:hypothetical protein [Actinomycetota bacterium]